ncbi:MAG: helix-turn-helix domain-containing protein [Alphaproteobacteria bacterium]|nr:helix-turn-helix domain-containing protein [Alphaproteobacteria bacterium]
MTNTPQIHNATTMNPVERRVFIKGQLELRRLNYADIARDLGCSRNAVAQAAAGGPSRRIHEALAAAIEWTVEELFPERYGPVKAGRAIPVRGTEHSRSAGRSHGQKREAA